MTATTMTRSILKPAGLSSGSSITGFATSSFLFIISFTFYALNLKNQLKVRQVIKTSLQFRNRDVIFISTPIHYNNTLLII